MLLSDVLVKRKVVISGTKVEYTSYELPEKKKERLLYPYEEIPYTKEDYLEKKHREFRTKATRLIECNERDLRRFITITYKENKKNLSDANKDFKAYIRKVKSFIQKQKIIYGNKSLYSPLKYACIVEFQKRGAVHYHLLTNLPYMEKEEFKEFRELWPYGSTKVVPVYDKVPVTGYLTRYITKVLFSDDYKHKKKFFYSDNLKKPSILYNDLADAFVKDNSFFLQKKFSALVPLFGNVKLMVIIYRLLSLAYIADPIKNWLEVLKSSFAQGANEEVVCSLSP